MCLESEDDAMATSVLEPPRRNATLTLQDLVDRLGGIPLSRILAEPAPGTATEADLIRVNDTKMHICELVDGVLVEKAMGLRESLLAGALISLLREFIKPRRLGIVTGEGGMITLMTGLVRTPDVAFIPWKRLPGGRIPDEPMPQVAPELAIEVLSEGNTKPEMERKREEYSRAGVDFVWEVDPRKQSVTVFERGRKRPVHYDRSQTIEAGKTLKGFRLVLPELFGELEEIEARLPESMGGI
jgi:Uma2 family endonuclease